MARALRLTQWFTVWLLPLIVIGGPFYPLLGYLVLAMMASLLTLSFFRGRYWCWRLCPRGAFLDLAVSRASFGLRLPEVFSKRWFRWTVFAALMAFLTWRLAAARHSLLAVGAVFVTMCLVTTILALLIGVPAKARGWCMICPMGTLQEQIAKVRKKARGGATRPSESHAAGN